MCPEIDSNVLKTISLKYDPINNEHYTLVDFKSIRKFIPNNIYQVIIKP